ncbi:putative phospholipid-transporting ATPase VB [Desmophyllum pertusum]|uniref:Phospholipid-transporting ATPase n=1 Tax=Desmophyllum pertusum TaxID=174260 RepID=A0A9W9ZQI4_9CNID|nr:putative phospholipid-transporting ATPase VB [Desmophyllum pertusum]
MAPLIFVLSVTAIKDLFEDRRRYKSDKAVNNSICHVFNRETEEYQPIAWKKVVVGDFVKLRSDESIPSDILLLNTSDANSVCHIETSNLDGETNLKQREVVKGLNVENPRFSPGQFPYKLKCEVPNNHIHRFHGTLITDDDREIPVGKNNLLLRGCVIRNTDWAEGMVVYAGHDSKALMNNSGPRYKRSKVERDLNLDVIACVAILFILCFLGGVGCGFWTDRNDFFNRHFTPGSDSPEEPFVRGPLMEGFIRFWTFVIILQVLIPISLYVSMEVVKLVQVYFISNDLELYYADMDQPVLCRALNINEDLGQIKYVFSDKTGTLTENKMVFKRCTIGGRNFSHKERLGLDAVDSKPSSSSAADQMYHQISDGSKDDDICWDKELAKAIDMSGRAGYHCGPQSSYLREFFILLAICNTVVVTRRSSGTQNSRNSRTDDTDLPSSPDNNHAPLDLGEYRTLNNHLNPDHESTRPQSMDSNAGHLNLGVSTTPVKPSLENLSKRPKSPISVIEPANECNTGNTELIYEAESPDEAALVKAAHLYGYKLLSRSPEKVTLYIPGEGKVTYELLHVLPFDSSRKRMSIVVRRQDDSGIVLYCKGADSAVLPKLERKNQQFTADEVDAGEGAWAVKSDSRGLLVDETASHLDLYARDGLRTLCMAKRDLSSSDYEEWLEQHRHAETALHDRERLLHTSAHKLECNMELLGATGIEDRLQDGVPETIARLREGGLKVWVLTGDKQETAINVAYSCRLLDNNMQKVILNAKSKDECSDQITSWLSHFQSEVVSITSDNSCNTVSGNINTPPTDCQPIGLVIDGRTLMYALEEPLNVKFLDLAKRCQAVLCCRATPLQKSAVVQLVRSGLNTMTLAIGDGANDVSMIQMADVGIGISGQEGMQAVMASDFAIGRFKFLSRLLLVHGHWCYDRICKMFLYFFFKNAMFVLVLFWFQLYNGFSGSNAIDDISLILFNLLFTAVPPVVCGILDKDVPDSILSGKPALYKSGQNSELYTRKLFWLTILDALYQSLVVFYAAFWVYDGSIADIRMVGVTLHQSSVIVANLYLALITAQWTILHHVILWGSIVLSFLWFAIFGVLGSFFWEMYYVPFVTMATVEFWSVCALSAVLALLPRVVITVARHTIWPTEIHKAQLQSKQRREDTLGDTRRSRTTYVEQSPEIKTTGVSVSL